MSSQRRGAALMVALFAGAALGIAVLSLSSRTSLRARAVRHESLRHQAECIVESVVTLARASLAVDDPALDTQGDAWNRPITLDELAARLQLDGRERTEWALRMAIEDEQGKRLVHELGEESLRLLGMSDAQADSLLDWIDADRDARVEGSETGGTPGPQRATRAKNQPLQSLGELDQLASFWPDPSSREVSVDWSTRLTTWTDGRLNVNTAPPEVLGSLPIDPSTAERILSLRASEASARGWKSMDEMRIALAGAPASDIAFLEANSVFRTSTFLVRVEVRHTLSGVTAYRRCVVVRATGHTHLLEVRKGRP